MFFKLSKGLNAPPERASTDITLAARRVPTVRVGSPFYLHLQLEDGPMFDPCRIPGSRSLHERKTATWALLIGETYSSAVHAETRQRPHRGMLPDVDFSHAVPDYSRPSLVRRIIRLIRPSAKTGAKIRIVKTSSASSNETVGERPATTYIARSRTGEADDSVSPVLDARRSGHVVRSRAA
ncbi:hypothetical protein [Mesorhizobium sp. M0778]|uniref:hypothetical protein n=1 Tax=Mesorhizobium sp. M0778 TaxID=2956999 RepID=UPI0033379EF2